mgnify:CR=1 FL=1
MPIAVPRDPMGEKGKRGLQDPNDPLRDPTRDAQGFQGRWAMTGLKDPNNIGDIE